MGKLVEVVLPPRLGADYRWLLASSWTTNLGDGVAVAAGPLLVASLTSDAFLVSLAALLRWAPPLVFGLSAGVLSDRLNRRRIVIAADGIRAVVLSVLVVTMVTGQVTVTVALVALGLLATAEVFADNTSTTLAPMLVHRDDLPVANSRLQAGAITLNQLAGPPIGAALFAAGRAWPFVAQAVLAAAGVLLVSRVVLPAHGRGSPAPRPWAGSPTRDTSSTPAAARTAWATNGHARPAANRAAPIGGPASWLSVMAPAWSRELATGRSSRCTSIGASVVEVLSANTSAVASRPRATSATVTVTCPVTIVTTSTLSTTARMPSAAITIRRRLSRSDSTPADKPNTKGGAHRSSAASETRNASLVSDATNSGPAATATPSPRFVVHDDASSQR